VPPAGANPVSPGPEERTEGRRLEVRGVVQGVGFRPWIHRLAREAGITGSVRNDAGGATIEAFGAPSDLARLRDRLLQEPPGAARIRELRETPLAGPAPSGFAIAASDTGGHRGLALAPDLATCDACLAESVDPGDRRRGYPFTTCTACGPRYGVALAAPWDRARTTMAPFRMCPACRREHADPADRRHHTETNACPACGPRLELLDAGGRRLPARDPVAAAAERLRRGETVALRGLGGFHLACDATSSEAVKRLRERKRRPAKPFAVMVADLPAARRLARLGPEEEALLVSPERPIVLAAAPTATPDGSEGPPPREGPLASALAPEVAPGLGLLGLLLPYTPLHHLLLAAFGGPLVMTSGNRADEPIATATAEAVTRLGRPAREGPAARAPGPGEGLGGPAEEGDAGTASAAPGIADAFLTHDREIPGPCDDSVVRVVAGAPVVLRRSRGYVPRALPIAPPLPEPILALGAHLKSAVCLGAGNLLYPGPHVGDLETLEACEALARAAERLEQLLGVRAEVVAHDLHPGYGSTRLARARRARRRYAVQHHHAHVASAMAEHGLEGPVLGLAWDGTGLGPDGAAWGGELLLADRAGFRRLATFRPIPLVGGSQALREPWRLALAWLEDAFGPDAPLDRLALFEGVDRERRAGVRQILCRRIRLVPAHGVGRLFDALGALVLARPMARYEGELALRLNLAADADPAPGAAEAYPFLIGDRGERLGVGEPDADALGGDALPGPEAAEPGEGPRALREVDLRPLLRAAVEDLMSGVPASRIAGRFHATLAAAAASLVENAAGAHGRLPVVLAGGCFQNPLLTRGVAEGLRARLGPAHPVLHGREIPPGDGGIAVGQAVVAAARLARGDRGEDD